MARKLEVEIVGDASSLSRAFGKASDSAGGFGSTLAKVGKVAAVAGAAIGAGMAVGIGKSIRAASDLNESINAVNVVFGKAAKQVLAFSEDAASKAGLSMRQFNELVTPVGASLINTGFSADQAAKASINLAKRAADMASVFNVDVGDALAAIQAGLRGEADPLERFGVGLSDAAVKAQALTMGLAQTEKELTANDKAQARLALIMKQTDKVAGDFVNTSDGLANSQRIAGAALENIAANLGAAFLPAVAKAASGVADFLSKFQEAEGAGAKFRVVIDSIKEVASQAWDALRNAFNAIDWGAVMDSVAAAIKAGVSKVTSIDWASLFASAKAGISAAVGAIFTALKNAFNAIDWGAVWDSVKKIAAAGLTELKAAFNAIPWGTLGKLVGDLIVKALNMLDDFIKQVNWAAVARAMVDGFKAAVKAVATFLANVDWMAVIGKTIQVAAGVIKALATVLGTVALELGKAIIRGMQDGAEALWGKFVAWLSSIPGKIKGLFAGAGSWLYDAGLAILQGLWDGLKSKWEAVSGWVGGLGGKIKGLKGPIDKDAKLLFAEGEAIVGGLFDGMKAKWGTSMQFLGGMSSAIVAEAKKLQAQLDAINRQREAEDRASAVRQAQAALQEAIKSNGNIAEARRALARAEQDIDIAAQNDRIAKLQAHLDKVQGTIEARQSRFQQVWDKIAATATAAFDRTYGQMETNAEKQLALIEKTEAEKGRLKELADAKQALADAQTDAEKLAAMERVRQAELAITVAGLQEQAKKEREILDARIAIKSQKFQEALEKLEKALAKEGATQEEAHAAMMRLYQRFGIDYGNAGAGLGGAFAAGIRSKQGEVEQAAGDLARASAAALAAASAAQSGIANAGRVVGGWIPGRAHGGPVRRLAPYVVGERGPELFIPRTSGTIIPNGRAISSGRGAVAATTVHFSFPNYVGDKRDLVDFLRAELVKVGRRNPGALGGLA